MTALQTATLQVAKKKRAHIESKEQRALVEWAGYTSLPAAPDIDLGSKLIDYLFAIPNGGKRNLVEAQIMKAEGVKPGVSDLMLPLARGGAHGLWLEMKRSVGGSESGYQRDWRRRMVLAGYKAVVCNGFDEACAAICDYMGMRSPVVVKSRPRLVEAETAVRSFLKSKVVRSSTYLGLVAKRRCINCGIQGYSQAAHENHNKAKSMKVDDRKTMPLCHVGANDCHGKFDQYKLFASRAEHIAMGMRWSRETRQGIRAEGLWPDNIEYME